MNLASKIKDLWEMPEYKKLKVKIKNGRYDYSDKVGQEIIVKRFGTMGCHDVEGNYYDFYDLDFQNAEEVK